MPAMWSADCVPLRACRCVPVQRRRQRTHKPRIDIGPVGNGDLCRDLGRHQYDPQLRHHHGRRHPGWAKLFQQPRRRAVQLRSARAGRLADERGHDRAGRPGGCRSDAARRPLRADADRHLCGGCKRAGGHVRPDRRLRHRPACRHGGCEHRLSADPRADALRDPDGARRRYRQRPQPVGQPGLACRAFVPRSRDGGTRHCRRFHDQRSQRQRDVGRQQSQLGVGRRRWRGDARAARAAQYAWAAKLQGSARSAAAGDLPGQPDRRTAGQRCVLERAAELPRQRFRHRLHRPRGAMSVGRRRRTFPRQQHARSRTSASTKVRVCSRLARSLHSTMYGGSVLPPAINRASSTRRPEPAATASRRKWA